MAVKNFPSGQPIVVAVHGRVLQAKTTRGGRRRVRYKIVKGPPGFFGPKFLTLREEGIIWARGWEGEAADALRVAVALST